ncbi:Cyclin-dependent kinase-like 2 [Amphibalanus amphitrite]|uniref:Cyclin-dependent kinase-like 2 n=1 Tax=Amphibalanus amphitrite TaxID=1232801 RepID=A0A6A4XDH0_AMPAM|nr:Cyclin-dependent kinase-like 2 [Amphibalanus amphitrite]
MRLRHENLVNLLEVFRRKRRLCLVFEFVESTALDLLEARSSGGLDPEAVRSYTFQLLRALEFCHAQNIIHRDIKPENVLISGLGVLKLCDFGFARPLAGPGENCTDYVATRWYRAPELLVGDTRYGREVDVWAAGCLFSEVLTGDPLFPGDSDIDQLYQIIQTTGPLSKAHLELLTHNPAMSGLRLSPAVRPRFAMKFPSWPQLQVAFLQDCLEMDPLQRPTCTDLLQHEYFTHDEFPQRHVPEIRRKIQLEFSSNSLGRKFGSLAIGKKRKGSKLTPNKENQEFNESKKEKEVRDALKSSPYRQSQARISVGRLAGSHKQEPIRTAAESHAHFDPSPSAGGGGGGVYPAIDGAPPPALPAHGWVRDTLMGWNVSGLNSFKNHRPCSRKIAFFRFNNTSHHSGPPAHTRE